MITKEAKLSNKVFQKEVESVPTRNGYGEALLELGESNPDVVVLAADLAESTRALDFAKKFPDRFIECGVAEQNMMGIAAGLAGAGKNNLYNITANHRMKNRPGMLCTN